jgi:hypothetical protein
LGLSIIGEIESYYRMCDSCPTIAYVIQAPLLHPSKLIAVKKHPEWVPVRVKSYKSLGSLHYKSLNFYNPTNVHDKRASQTSERRTFLNILDRNHYKNITNYSIN